MRGDPRRLRHAYTVKKSLVAECECPYRKPTLVGKGKCPKVDERTLVKELGKMTP